MGPPVKSRQQYSCVSRLSRALMRGRAILFDKTIGAHVPPRSESPGFCQSFQHTPYPWAVLSACTQTDAFERNRWPNWCGAPGCRGDGVIWGQNPGIAGHDQISPEIGIVSQDSVHITYFAARCALLRPWVSYQHQKTVKARPDPQSAFN